MNNSSNRNNLNDNFASQFESQPAGPSSLREPDERYIEQLFPKCPPKQAKSIKLNKKKMKAPRSQTAPSANWDNSQQQPTSSQQSQQRKPTRSKQHSRREMQARRGNPTANSSSNSNNNNINNTNNNNSDSSSDDNKKGNIKKTTTEQTVHGGVSKDDMNSSTSAHQNVSIQTNKSSKFKSGKYTASQQLQRSRSRRSDHAPQMPIISEAQAETEVDTTAKNQTLVKESYLSDSLGKLTVSNINESNNLRPSSSLDLIDTRKPLNSEASNRQAPMIKTNEENVDMVATVLTTTTEPIMPTTTAPVIRSSGIQFNTFPDNDVACEETTLYSSSNDLMMLESKPLGKDNLESVVESAPLPPITVVSIMPTIATATDSIVATSTTSTVKSSNIQLNTPSDKESGPEESSLINNSNACNDDLMILDSRPAVKTVESIDTTPSVTTTRAISITPTMNTAPVVRSSSIQFNTLSDNESEPEESDLRSNLIGLNSGRNHTTTMTSRKRDTVPGTAAPKSGHVPSTSSSSLSMVSKSLNDDDDLLPTTKTAFIFPRLDEGLSSEVESNEEDVLEDDEKAMEADVDAGDDEDDDEDDDDDDDREDDDEEVDNIQLGNPSRVDNFIRQQQFNKQQNRSLDDTALDQMDHQIGKQSYSGGGYLNHQQENLENSNDLKLNNNYSSQNGQSNYWMNVPSNQQTSQPSSSQHQQPQSQQQQYGNQRIHNNNGNNSIPKNYNSSFNNREEGKYPVKFTCAFRVILL